MARNNMEPQRDDKRNRPAAVKRAAAVRRAAPMVLFICTGNYYRSRFAEAVFNHHARKRRMPWRAFSRGLAIHLVEGDLSPFARAGLERREIDVAHTARGRANLALADLRRARVRVALDAREHGPMLAERFAAWVDRVEYWEVADVGITDPDCALKTIEARVLELLDRLPRGEASAREPCGRLAQRG